jgi:hypothetical protein
MVMGDSREMVDHPGIVDLRGIVDHQGKVDCCRRNLLTTPLS